MATHPTLRAFNFENWVEKNQDQLKPPVNNKLLHDESGMIVMVVGGPNTRVDFHDDPVEEWFYQIKGDMMLKIADGGDIYDVPIREGEVFMLPTHTVHAPQRPQDGSIGIVVESPRMMGMMEGFEWYCFDCKARVHRIEVPLGQPSAIVTALPTIYD
ncbi:MAG: 3-hydroxyanthranilate 3,4-dioxygenase, partial [Gammaproteobacteria bacterium]|nr:3-hydroxyanthranilate 3,4-dioxygenase [Gammaproteobacteria bacterium]